MLINNIMSILQADTFIHIIISSSPNSSTPLLVKLVIILMLYISHSLQISSNDKTKYKIVVIASNMIKYTYLGILNRKLHVHKLLYLVQRALPYNMFKCQQIDFKNNYE